MASADPRDPGDENDRAIRTRGSTRPNGTGNRGATLLAPLRRHPLLLRHLDPDHRALEGGFFDAEVEVLVAGGLLVFEFLLGAGAGAFGAGFVDVGGELAGVDEQDDAFGAHVGEAAADGGPAAQRIVAAVDFEFADADRREAIRFAFSMASSMVPTM